MSHQFLDKGSGTVVMDRQDYLNECYRQLNNQQFCEKVNEDPTEGIKTRDGFLPQKASFWGHYIIDKETHNYLPLKIPKQVVVISCLKSTKLEIQVDPTGLKNG